MNIGALESKQALAGSRPWLWRGFGGWTGWVASAAVLLVLIAGANLLVLALRPDSLIRHDVGGWGDQELLSGFWSQESAAGTTYRWTQARSVFQVRGFPIVAHPVLRLAIGGLPPTAEATRILHLAIDGQLLNLPVTAQARRYHLLAPSGMLSDGDLDLGFASATSTLPPDDRALGVRLDDIVLGWSDETVPLPDWQTLAVQWALVLVWLAIAWRLGLPVWLTAIIALLLVPLQAGMSTLELLMAQAWQLRLLLAGLLLLALAWNASPLLLRAFPELAGRREVRWLALITLAAIGVRLFAISYPPFESHDLYIHRKRLLDFQLGSLLLFDTPSEFAGRRTIVPPAYYLLASPLTLLSTNVDFALQALYGFIDGAMALPLAIIVRQIGGRPRAALLAAVIIACLPIQMTALWWGFGPQVLGQWLLLVLAVFAAYRYRTTGLFWLAATLLLTLSFLTHPGVAILGAFWLAGYVALNWWQQRRDRPGWLGWGAVLLASALLSLALLYMVVLELQLRGLASGAVAPYRFDEYTRLRLIGVGMRASLRPIGALLSALSLLVLLRQTGGQRRRLVVAWLASAALFFAVDVASSLQVRYAYFAIPMICAGLGLLLDRLMATGIWGRIAGWSFAAIVAYSGLTLLFDGVFWGIKPTLFALLH
jgi:hypothetical protein